MQGFILLHRQITESAVFKNPNLLKFWIYCLCKVSHKEHTTMVGLQEVNLQKGQFVFGRKVASTELNFTESSTYKYLKTLEKMQMISINSNNKFSVVSVINWGKFQTDKQESNNKVTTTQQQDNNKATTKKQQSNTNNNDNNVDNVDNDKKKDKDVLPDKSDDIISFFESIWILIPSHKNDVKKNIKPVRRKELYNIGYERIKVACDKYLSGTKEGFRHKRDNFFNNIIDNYLVEEQAQKPVQEHIIKEDDVSTWQL